MLKLAIFGCGYWGRNLVRNFSEMSNVDLAICCDTNTAQLDEMRKNYPNLAFTSDYDAVVRDSSIEAVSVCVPASMHYKVVKDCLEHGKHVLVEKPLASCPAEARDLVRLAEEQGRVLMVGHIFLFSPVVAKLRELIQNGELGQLRYIYSIRCSLGPRVREDVNVVWDYLIHDAYLLPYLVGHRPLEVRASGGAYLREDLEDVVFATLLFPGGVVTNSTASWYDPVKTRRMVIVGSQKMAIYDEERPDNKLVIYDRGYAPHEGYDSFGNKNLRLYEDGFRSPPVEPVEPLRAECEHFVECIADGCSPLSDAAAGAEVVDLLTTISRSLKEGGVGVGTQDV